VRIALAVGLALALLALGVVLSRSPLTVVGTNASHLNANPFRTSASPLNASVQVPKRGSNTCQQVLELPEGTSAIRVSATANVGPRVTLSALSGPTVITHGTRGAGWGIAESVTVPVQPTPRAIANANICLAFGPAAIGRAFLYGVWTLNGPPDLPHSAVTPRFEYLRPGPASWWSLAPSVITRMGFGHAPSGTWVVFVVLGLMITLATLAVRLVLRELR
jgi:hypothetical protein